MIFKKREILYSQCWEDPEMVEKSLDLRSGDDLIIITSGGCNVLNLSLVEVGRIVAIDNNPAQNFLLELKLASIKNLGYDDFFSFMGAGQKIDRLEKYRELKSKISLEAVLFWDGHRRYIEEGLLQCGRFEHYIEIFRDVVLPLAHDKKTILRLLSFKDLSQQIDFYRKEWNNRRWKAIFYLFFNRKVFSRFGRKKEMFGKHGPKGTEKFFLERLEDFFSKKTAKGNYFLYNLFIGGYEEGNYPPYLSKENFDKLKKSVNKIDIVTGSVMDQPAYLDKNKKYKFCLSDIFESFSEKETDLFFEKLSLSCAKGSRLCFWNNLSDRKPAENGKWKYLEERAEELSRLDKVFFYKKFYVYERL